MRAPVFILATLLLGACTKPRHVEGTVNDIFGQPINEAAVRMDKGPGPVDVESGGRFAVEVSEPGTKRLMAGAEGYIKDVATVEVPEEGPIPTVEFALWPKPESPGFFVPLNKELAHLEAARVTALTSGQSELHGVKKLPATRLKASSEPTTMVFRSTLRSGEINQIDLDLYQLEYRESVTMPGLTGDQTVTAKMWMAKDKIPFEITATMADEIYQLSTEAPLEPGAYAFSSQKILQEAEAGDLARLPSEMQVVHAFEVIE